MTYNPNEEQRRQQRGDTLDAQLKQFYIRDLPGMNNKLEDLQLDSNYVEIAQNCRFEGIPGTVTKRPPVSYFNGTSVGSDPCVGLFRFYPPAVFVAVFGNKVYVGSDTAGTFTEIRTLTSTGKRMAFVVYKDLLIMSNGFDTPFVYGGASDNITWELGACKAAIGSGTGITKTGVSYKITFDSDAYIPGTVSNTIATASNEDIELTNIPLGPIGTVNRKIYREDSGTTGYRLVTTIADNTTTTYTDTTNDVSAGAAIPPTTDEMPKGNILQIHRERLLISGDPSNPSRIYYANPYLPHYIQQTVNLDYMDISPEDNDVIMGIPINLGTLICIKKNTIRKVLITSATAGSSPKQWYAEDPVVFVGSPAQWSIVQTLKGIIFLGWDHWYLFNGNSATPIIDQFDTNDILPADYSDVVAHYTDNILLAAYSDRTLATTYHNRCMFYNAKRNKLGYDTINVNCFATKNGDDENGELFYGDSTQGYVYQAENNEISYRLRKKSEANDGTKSSVFVGGTEDTPYIEIGSVTAASEIPDDICIFWDAEDAPGDGWTEITNIDNRFIKIDSGTPGTTGTMGVADLTNDEESHSVYQWRVFKRDKGSGPAVYEFPDGAIVMFDQPFAPVGYTTIYSGYYVQVNTTAGATQVTIYPDTSPTADGTGQTLDSYSTFRFIKKIAEASTWNGVDNYVFCLYYGTAAPGNGWTDVTDETWDDDNPCVPTFNTNSFEAEDHGLEDDERVYIIGDTVPTGISAATQYWVISATEDTWQVSLTLGGAAVNFTDDGNNVSYRVRRRKYRDRFLKTGESEGYVYGGDTSELPDWVRLDATVHQDSHSVIKGLLEEELGTDEEVYDGDDDTFHGYKCHHADDGTAEIEMRSTHEWITPLHVDEFHIKARSYPQPHGNYTASSSADFIYEYYTSDGWQEFSNVHKSGPGDYTEDDTFDNGGAGWDDVLGVRVTINANAYSYEGERQQDATVWVYSIEATGIYERVNFHLANKVLGQMLDYNASLITHTVGSGTWTSPALNLGVQSFGQATWNETLIGSDDITVSTRTAATEAAISGASWSTALTDPNGSDITSSANQWFQYKIDFSASDTTVSNPRVYLTNDFVVRVTYLRGTADAETSVEYVYELGLRNFETPLVDKIFKKLLVRHDGTKGAYKITWKTETQEGEFNIDLSAMPRQYESFFQSVAYGRELNIRIYKNDLNDFTLREIAGVFTPEPVRL